MQVVHVVSCRAVAQRTPPERRWSTRGTLRRRLPTQSLDLGRSVAVVRHADAEGVEGAACTTGRVAGRGSPVALRAVNMNAVLPQIRSQEVRAAHSRFWLTQRAYRFQDNTARAAYHVLRTTCCVRTWHWQTVMPHAPPLSRTHPSDDGEGGSAAVGLPAAQRGAVLVAWQRPVGGGARQRLRGHQVGPRTPDGGNTRSATGT